MTTQRISDETMQMLKEFLASHGIRLYGDKETVEKMTFDEALQTVLKRLVEMESYYEKLTKESQEK